MIERQRGEFFDRLAEIRKELEKQQPGLPKDSCLVAVQRVHQELGLKRYEGYYVVEGIGRKHSWNGDSSGAIVDITADQFDKSVPTIEILYPDDKRYKRYSRQLCLEDDIIVFSSRTSKGAWFEIGEN